MSAPGLKPTTTATLLAGGQPPLDERWRWTHRGRGEFFRVLKLLEARFALGHGRSIDRAVSKYLAQSPLRLAAMCGHRKMGFFGQALTRYLDKFRAVHMALAVTQCTPWKVISNAPVARGTSP